MQGKHKRGAKLLMENSGVARLVDESGKVVQPSTSFAYWCIHSTMRLLHEASAPAEVALYTERIHTWVYDKVRRWLVRGGAFETLARSFCYCLITEYSVHVGW